jgi:tetratricopeptide (TPR) repeat protein
VRRQGALGLVAALAMLGGCASLRLPPPGTADRAQALLEQGRAAEAAAAAREVHRRSTDYARAQEIAARALIARARVPPEALARGIDLEARGKLLEAEAAYEAGLVAEPKHQQLLARLGAVRDGLQSERERRRFAAERAEAAGRLEAERAWAALASIDPENGDVRRRLTALATARRALAELHLGRARSLRDDGFPHDALEEAELAARLDPSRDAARELAALLRKDEPPIPSEARGEPAGSRVPPGAPGTRSGDARDNRVARRPASPAQTAPAPRPELPAEPLPAPPAPAADVNADSLAREAIQIARAAVRRGDYPQAVSILVRVESLGVRTPELTAERAAVGRLVQGEVQERIKAGIARFQLEDLEGAIDEWGRALELDPENAVALDYRRKALSMRRRIEELREESRDDVRRPPAERRSSGAQQ